MRSLWRLLVEMSVPPEDCAGDTLGFMNIVTWAASATEAQSKIAAYLKTFGWHLLEVDQAHPVDELTDIGEELEDMIQGAQNNDHAIFLGTFGSGSVSN